MKKIFSFFIVIFLLALTGDEGFAQNYTYPNTITVSAPADYCVGAVAAPLSGSFTQTSCGTGAFTSETINYRWYYNTSNTVSLIVATPSNTGTVSTTASGSVTIPGPTPLTTLASVGLRYYFCVITWGTNGCVASDSIYSSTNQILVGPPVITGMSISPNPACWGDSIYFSAPTIGGTSYVWAGPTISGYLNTAYNPLPFSVNDSDAGYFTFTATNACGSTKDSVLLVVNQLVIKDSAYAVNDTVCSGTPFTLHGVVVTSTPGSTLYNWVGPNGFTSTLQTPPTFTSIYAEGGTYTFTATSPGCNIKTATVHVQVDSLPKYVNPWTNPNPVCTGYNINLKDTSWYGTSYLWKGPSGYTSTLHHPVPFPATAGAAGVYTLIVTNSCGSDTGYTSPLVVHPTPAPITGDFQSLCADSIRSFANTTAGGHWTSSNTGVATVSYHLGNVVGVSGGTTIIYYSLPDSMGGCYDSVIVQISNPPLPISGSRAKLCDGDTLRLSDPTSGGIWTSGNNKATVDSFTGFVVAVTSGRDVITYSTLGCTPQYFPITINPLPSPILGDTSICRGAVVTVSDNTAGGTWTTTNGTITSIDSITGTGSAIVTGLRYGKDSIVYYFKNSGCKTVLKFTVDTLPKITITGLDSICKGECTPLSATFVTDGVYRWKPDSGISCTNCGNVNACPLETHIYKVVVSSGANCTDSATHKLTVNPLPILSYSPDPFYMCRGTDKVITASGAATYFWYPNVFISNNTIVNPSLSDTADLVYTLHGTTLLGCTDSIKVPVSVLDSANTTLSPDTIICIGNHTTLIATSTDPTTTYKWFIVPNSAPTSLSSSTDFKVIATPDSSTHYGVTITENACFEVTRYVSVFVDPLPNVVIARPNTIIAGSSVNLSAVITNGDTGMIYEWTPSETVSCPSCPTTAVTPTVTTLYSVCVTTNRGCLSCDSMTVKIMCDNSQVFIPNTFTPNGDGYNDRFYVSGKGLSLITNLVVYNRWGQLVYQAQNIPANDPSYGWDGTYKGQILEPDVFMYVLEVMCETDNVLFKFHGDISIVR